MTNRRLVAVVAAASIFLKVTASLSAQDAPAKSLNVSVNGRSFHSWSSGLESRKPGQPVVILEAGVPGTVEMWRPVFPDISRDAPVFAYDHSGLGQSEFDGDRPTDRAACGG
jgi:pimeloyl-ACP methyl ester carboxylesterase